ncbi:dephospho-CoA kinase [Panacibacter sp. DH6]|uniref:Dephospho-CoA kinase n=1 Tax=Panacibacter microcysteis TaxID=2793269 RepID=A0A931GZC3_9BACT|nr:dephospho-CoA kinase [Panacibacter microcysteis]MBG9378151.1 dephospho-CoA kinase [Panacibacter microcysteis]
MGLKVGLTGGIGSGKSTVARIFKTLGVPVFDADAAAKKVMNEDVALKQQVTALFGEEAYIKNELNRKYIASVVFNDSFKLEQLNAIVHPATIAAGEAWMNKQTTPYTLKEAAIFFESGSAAGLDYMIGVFAPQHLRIRRVMQRDNITREEVLSRMSKQIDEFLKMKLCDFVISNDEQSLLIPQVLNVHGQLLAIKQKHGES